MGEVTRIVLSRVASDALTATGERAFAVIGRASYPDDPTRWVIHIAPVSFETAHDACRVLLAGKTVKKTRRANPGESHQA